MAELSCTRTDLDLRRPAPRCRPLDGEPAYRAGQVWDGLYRRWLDPGELTDAAQGAAGAAGRRARRCSRRSPSRPMCARADGGDTVKWLWRLARRRAPSRPSSCTTPTARRCACRARPAARWRAGSAPPGQAGFERHLTAGEIVEQVVRAARRRPATAAAPVERRVHGHGRAAGQLRPTCGRGRAPPRRPRPLGPPPHDLDRRHRARHPPPRRASDCPSTSPCRCTRPTTSCATSWSRSTAATRSTR